MAMSALHQNPVALTRYSGGSTTGNADQSPEHGAGHPVQVDASTRRQTDSAEDVAQAPPSTHDAANLYRTPASSFGIAQEVAENYGATSVLQTPTSALPGSSTHSQLEAVPVYQLFDFALPPKGTLDAILDTYLNAVHWFMLLFHEPSFRL